jgi:2-keto-4-pentenoate hydratase/2-oxohepta-3-ene-1,7-dioic acid hydratase in catechol pathway
MRFVSYLRDGAVRHGRIEGDLIAELGDGDLQKLVERGLSTADVARSHHQPEAVELLAPLQRPGKLLAAAANYQDHVTETGGEPLDKSRLSPRLFLKPPTSIVGPGATIPLPDVSHEVDWEAELAVVIGKAGKHIAKEDAYDHVAGYALFNDVSVRDWQIRKPPIQFGAGKNFDGSGPFGPELVTRDEVEDPMALDIELKVNGETMQSANTADMIFDIPTLIEHVSQFTTLEPGDVIATGTPSGVGHFREPPVYLKDGDVVRVEIDGLGALENPVVAE